MKLGEKISKIRRSKGMSQVFITQRLSKTSAWLSNIERCRREIGAKELNQVAEILGVDISVFFTEELNGELSVGLKRTASEM